MNAPLETHKPKTPKQPKELIEGRDFYFENGLMVLTAHFLRERGYCCGNGCRHCPYPPGEKPQSK